jgi:polysaccharide biosynthesis protein PslH
LTPSKPARRRLLLLSPFAPRLDASMGGPLVIAQLIRALSQRERVALLYLRAQDEPPLDDQVKCACEVASEIPRTDHTGRRSVLSTMGRFRRSVLSTMGGLPSWVEEWHEPAFSAALSALAHDWSPDVVQVEFHLMGQYLPALAECASPTVLNQHEPGAAAVADRRRSGLMPGRILPLLEQYAWERYERRLARQLDAIVTFTERDRKVMQSLGATRVEVIAPGAAIPKNSSDPLGALPPSVLFFGNYLHAPNVDAALRLARDIFPRLNEAIPDLQLLLLGDHAPDRLRALSNHKVLVTGRVPELKPYLDQASVVVVPVRIGGGLRVKILEAIAAGKAVVASRLALEGLDVVAGEQVLSAESDEEFVQQVLWLLRNPDERAALATRARAWAAAHLSWDRAARRYSALYDQLEREHALNCRSS